MGIIHVIIFLAIGGKIAPGQDHFPEGERIFIQDAPYFVSIRNASRHICGGVLIRNDLVLTSAHIVQYDPITVVSGVDEDNPLGTVHQVAGYDSLNFALLGEIRLSNPISIDGVAETVNMPLYELSYDETAHFISFRPENGQLRRTEVAIAPWPVCSTDERLLCATRIFDGGIRGDKIGGPLIQHGRLIGIATHLKGLNEGYNVYINFQKPYKNEALDITRFRPRG